MQLELEVDGGCSFDRTAVPPSVVDRSKMPPILPDLVAMNVELTPEQAQYVKDLVAVEPGVARVVPEHTVEQLKARLEQCVDRAAQSRDNIVAMRERIGKLRAERHELQTQLAEQQAQQRLADLRARAFHEGHVTALQSVIAMLTDKPIGKTNLFGEFHANDTTTATGSQQA